VADGPRLGVPELTRRGWTVAGACTGLFVAGFFVGGTPVVALGLSGGLVLAWAWVSVLVNRVSLPLTRSARPARPAVGQEGRVVLRGRTTRPTPWLTITESVDGGRRAARFVQVPLDAGTPVEAIYRIPTDRRGRHIVGPALVTVADPSGLVRRTWAAADAGEVIVQPRVHDVVPPRRGGGGEPAERADGPRIPVVEALGEFLALRDYEPGDDPRRVHWRSSARAGELLVRVDEAPAPGRVVILFDVRRGVYDDDAFESAVEVVASIAASLHRTHQAAEVVTSAGESMRRGGVNALQSVLDRLAVVEPDGPDRLLAVTAALRGRAGLGGVVVVTGAADAAVVDAAAALRGRRVVTLVTTGATTAATGPMTRVDVAGRAFPTIWNATMRVSTRWQPANSRSRSPSPR
jgi:uncharacterized protein (DUF58 family)